MVIYTTLYESIMIIMLILFVFIIESMWLFKKKRRVVMGYILFNEALLLMMCLAIHKYLFSIALTIDKIFTSCMCFLFFILLCYLFYPIVSRFSAKIDSDREKGYT